MIKKCVICKTNLVKYGDTCSLECGKKFQKNNTMKNIELEKENKPVQDGIYSNQNINLVDSIKKEIVTLKTTPKEQKQLFFNKKIKPMIDNIDGNREQWNAVCSHLKNYYNKNEYKFIRDLFKQAGMSIH